MSGRTKATKPEPLAELTMRLFAPGMSALHRAGLGGLACTLRMIEKRHAKNPLPPEELPGDWTDGPPWSVTTDAVALRFGEPGAAREYLRRLYALAFALEGEMIHLPGQHRMPTSPGIRADLQLGLTLTFLQHGKTRALAKSTTVAQHDPEGDGGPPVLVEYRACTGYKHQDGWEDLTHPNTGRLVDKPVGVEGPLNPGAIVRHIAFAAATQADDPVKRLLPLHFAPVGCLALPVNRGVGVLVVPEVDDLPSFAKARPRLTPRTPGESVVSGGSDAALQMQVRLKGEDLKLVGAVAVTFRPTAWASQQKSRVHALHVPPLGDRALEVYRLALRQLPLRIVRPKIKESVGRGRTRQTVEQQESFRTDSVVRPLIAENLATGRPWYAGFTALMTRTNPATDRPFRDAVRNEQWGLHAMVSDPNAWIDQEGQRLVVQAVHEAIRQRFGKIAGDYESQPRRMEKKFNEERERIRRSFAGAKTPAQARNVLFDLFSLAGVNSQLQPRWHEVLLVLQQDWQLARDLGLLALASYASQTSTRGGNATVPDAGTPNGDSAQ